MDHIGPCTFLASRFLLSAAFVLPLVFYEKSIKRLGKAARNGYGLHILMLCLIFTAGDILQQYGLTTTTVTNTAFLTGLYVVMVPFVGYVLYKQKLSFTVFIAGLFSVIGVWFLSGGTLDNIAITLGRGEILVLLCALCFALQVSMLGNLTQKLKAPMLLSFLQYLAVGLITLVLALVYEEINLAALKEAWVSIAFAGIASGGIAYTLQAVAQQHTPSADAAIIMSSEALFGGIGGVWLLKEPFTFASFIGCTAIMGAIILVELAPLLRKTRRVTLKSLFKYQK